ncbi:MAG: type II secretion system F family protein [Planctomycetaceae bacterium]|nr:type II secretion system F family protein [Planctomycetaceae bacterium]
MSEPVPAFSSSISASQLDHLIGLCDEISALVRSGLPIETSLLSLSHDVPKRLRKHLAELVAQLDKGKSLADAVRDDPVFPPVYAAVVEAGIRSGDLAGALDSIAQSARVLRDTRSFLLQTAIYPMVLFTTLWFVFVGLFLFAGPRFAGFFDAYGRTTLLIVPMRLANDHLSFTLAVAAVVPVVLWGMYLIWAIRSGRGNVIQSSGRTGLLTWVPWVGRATVQLQKMTFAKILAILVKSSVPLDQAILLTAKATNDRYWSRENIEKLQQRIVSKTGDDYPHSSISPLIVWATGMTNQQLLVEGLEQFARMARVRADLLITRCQLILPGLIIFGFAIVIALCYVLTVMWPYHQLLNFLSTVMG